MRIGFSGTREGMNGLQIETVQNLMEFFMFHNGTRSFVIAHHGNCKGADEQFHGICEEVFDPLGNGGIEVHRAISKTWQAFSLSELKNDELVVKVHSPKAPLTRNDDMAHLCDFGICAPISMTKKGGTWDSIGKYMAKGKTVFIITRTGNVWVQ